MSKIVRSCVNCIWYLKDECKGSSEPCKKWIYKKANCTLCSNLLYCKKLGKDNLNESNVCYNFKKDKKKKKKKKKSILSIQEYNNNNNNDNNNNDNDISSYSNDSDKDDLFSPSDLVESVIESNYDPSVFSLINEGDILKSHNSIQFILDKRFLNIKLWPKQLQIALQFFNSYCPYCSDNNFINNKIEVDTSIGNILDKIIFYYDGVCKKCGKSRYDAIEDKKFNNYNRMIGVAGQRSGKSILTGIFSATILHKYLQIPNPVEMLGLLPNSTLHGTFVGLRYQDAYDNLWEPFYNLITTAPWYVEYHKFLDEEGSRLGKEIFKLRDTFVTYNHKNIGFYPAGPDKRKLRGKCLPGYTLVNTSRGFIRLDDPKKLLGSYTYKGKSSRKIIDYEPQKYKKDVYRVTLENGIELDATYDHRVKVLTNKGKAAWREQQDLIGEYVFCQMGGEFPKELIFNHNIKKHEPAYVKLAKYIADGKIFTRQDISDTIGVVLTGVQWVIHPMLKAGVLNIKYPRTDLCYSLPAEYRINSKFKLKKWIKLRKGYINTNRDKVKLPNRMTPKLARLVGYLIADGWVTLKGNSIEYWTTSKDKCNDFYNCFKIVFGCNPRLASIIDKEKYVNGPGTCYVISFTYGSIIEFLTLIGATGGNAHIKVMPWSILEASRKCVVECVSAMISCDGGIINRSGRVGVYYYSKSYELCKSLQLLIMKLGYVCIRKFSNKGNMVYLTREDSVNFVKKEYTGLDKRDYKKDVTISKTDNPKSYIHHKIPFTNVYISSKINKIYNRNVRDIEDIKNVRFRKYCDKYISFSKVVSIEYIGKMKVYDLTVDSEDSTFAANNVLVHNTRIISALDELGWFFGGSNQVKYNPDEIYAALDNSLMTVLSASNKLLPIFPDMPSAYGFYISSPSSKADKSMRMYKQSKTSTSLYGFHYSTWEINPTITKEDLRDKFREDPVKTERDFGANPPYSLSPYISTPTVLIPVFSKKKNLLKIKSIKTVKDSLGGTLMYPTLEFNKVHTYPAVLSIDCSYNYDSFACSIMHFMDIDDKRVIATSGIIEIIPDTYAISFPKIYEHVITPIIENFNIKVVCLTGDTLLPTIHGLKRLDSLEDFNNSIATSLSTKGLFNNFKYNGIKDIRTIRSVHGFEVKGTADHKVKVLNKNYCIEWKEIKDIKKTDYMLIRTKPLNRTSKLKLFFPSITCNRPQGGGKLPEYPPKTPKVMTVELGFILGSLVSEGCVRDNYINFCNTNKTYINKFIKCFKQVFGVKLKATKRKMYDGIILGRKYKSNYEYIYIVEKRSRVLGSWLNSLGITFKTAPYKYIPWSILEADKDSQLSFMAGFIEGDGCISHNNIQCISSSKELLKQIQILLLTHGIFSYISNRGDIVNINTINSIKLIKLIKPFLGVKHKNFKRKYTTKRDMTAGIPLKPIIDYIISRRIKKGTYKGCVYKTNNNKKVVLSGLYPFTGTYSKYVSKKDLYNGYLDTVLNKLKVLDIELYNNFTNILKSDIGVPSKVKNNFKSGREKVYDITVPKTNEFIANGVLVHNCFDRWQSINLSQQIFQDHKIDAMLYSVKMSDFEDLRSAMYGEECIFPRLESKVDELILLDKEVNALVHNKPVNHLFLQFLMSQDSGRIITKGDDTTDDILRTICLGHAILNDENYNELFYGSGSERSLLYNDINSIIKLSKLSNKGGSILSSSGMNRSAGGIGAVGSRKMPN